MSWRKVKLGELLVNRENRFKPKDKAIQGLKRIDKIDFSGNIFLSDKPSNTDMILVKQGDLIISGINVEKGAMSVYQGKEDVTATIHYSSYSFNEKKIDIEFLKMFLKSFEFKSALKEQVPGGIKTEIKPKHILPLEIIIPTILSEQRAVVKSFSKIQSDNSDLETELTHQQNLLKQLRQSFLREAMQGKLVKQEKKDGHAKDLLQKIKAEKEKLIAEKKLKKEKPLPPIKEEEIPFAIPENWVWCRLGEICDYGSSPKAEPKDLTKTTWVLDLEDIEKETSNLLCKIRFDERNSLSTKSVFKKGEVLYSKLRPYLDKVIVADEDGVCTTEILPLSFYGNIDSLFMRFALKRSDFLIYVNGVTKGMKMPRLGTTEGKMALIPLPPLSEQKRIVKKLEELMNLCDELKTTITHNQTYTNQLLQVALKEALRMSEPVIETD
ncbi:MAG: restriction endonuclease subunit S [Verrucomicrobia bacterium]|nr:restriction endonuclease subunit S [Verrucomicrobiota bacterium]MBS1947618.1 restriction endonuclease subunit S [Bacteroidota bacterium]